MTQSATVMSKCADLARTAAIALALVASPALAAQDEVPDEPVAGKTPDAKDVAMTPLRDLNLAKDPIPPILLAATEDPYGSAGIKSCADVSAAIAPLDAVLGPDMDVAQSDDERISAGQVAKSVVASFIPFRGIIRELTGAADHQRDFQAAIYAGSVRRGYLKGLGQTMKCAYPARPAFARVSAPTPVKGVKSAPDGEQLAYVSEPVVQDAKTAKSAAPQRR